MIEESDGDIAPLTSRTFPAWKKGKMLGRGAHGTVYLARVVETDELVAVKCIQTEGIEEGDLEAIEHEIRMIKGLCHPNIVQYLGTENRRHALNIFLEYAPGGSLRQLLQEVGALEESVAATFTFQILLGLDYLHSNGIAHRDIKGANVLLSEDYSALGGGSGAANVILRGDFCKLADFGASKRVEAKSVVSGLKGTPHWMAPEVIKGLQSGDGWVKADIWSVGCTCIEILTGTNPWPKFPNPMAAMYRIASGERPPLSTPGTSNPKIYGQNAESFIDVCCRQDPLERPSAAQLLNFHPLLAGARELAKAAGTVIPKMSNGSSASSSSSSSSSSSNSHTTLIELKNDIPLTSPLITPLTRPTSKHIMFDLKEENKKQRRKKRGSNGGSSEEKIGDDSEDDDYEDDCEGEEEEDDDSVTDSIDSAGFQTVGSVDSDYGWEGHPIWRNLSGRENSIKEKDFYEDIQEDDRVHQYEEDSESSAESLVIKPPPSALEFEDEDVNNVITNDEADIFQVDVDDMVYEPSFPPPNPTTVDITVPNDNIFEPEEPLYEVPDSEKTTHTTMVAVSSEKGSKQQESHSTSSNIVTKSVTTTTTTTKVAGGNQRGGVNRPNDISTKPPPQKSKGEDMNIYPMFSPVAAVTSSSQENEIEISNRAGSRGRSDRAGSKDRSDRAGSKDRSDRAGSRGRSDRAGSGGRSDRTGSGGTLKPVNSRGSDMSSGGESEKSFGSFAAVPMRVNAPISNQNATVLRDIWGSPSTASSSDEMHTVEGQHHTSMDAYDDHHAAELGFGDFDTERPKGAAAGESTRSKTKRRHGAPSNDSGSMHIGIQSLSIGKEGGENKTSLVSLDRNDHVNSKNKGSKHRKDRDRDRGVGGSSSREDREGARSVPPAEVSARPSNPVETKRSGGSGYSMGSRLFNPEKTLTAREFTQQQGSNGSGGGGSSSGEQRPKGAMSGQLRKIDFLQSLERASTMGSAMIRAAAVEEADDPRLRYSKSAGLPSQVVTPSKKARLPPLQGGSPIDSRVPNLALRAINSAPSAVFNSMQMPPTRPVGLDPVARNSGAGVINQSKGKHGR